MECCAPASESAMTLKYAAPLGAAAALTEQGSAGQGELGGGAARDELELGTVDAKFRHQHGRQIERAVSRGEARAGGSRRVLDQLAAQFASGFGTAMDVEIPPAGKQIAFLGCGERDAAAEPARIGGGQATYRDHDVGILAQACGAVEMGPRDRGIRLELPGDVEYQHFGRVVVQAGERAETAGGNCRALLGAGHGHVDEGKHVRLGGRGCCQGEPPGHGEHSQDFHV